MLKKALRTIAIVAVLLASCGSFIYLNSTSAPSPTIQSLGSFEQEEVLPVDHGMQSPNVAIVKKAMVIAKCFLYPTD